MRALEKGPSWQRESPLGRIWEGEGPRRSEILNPVNNDYWVQEKNVTATGKKCYGYSYIKNVALFQENSILPLPERLESSGW